VCDAGEDLRMVGQADAWSPTAPAADSHPRNIPRPPERQQHLLPAASTAP
jgi:hypothetical protein